HHKEMMPQFKSLSLNITKENLQIGIALFAIGLFKKAILADSIADYVSPIYDEAAFGTITFLQAWIAGLGFTLQIYFDFSGYSDMALGAARMFGIILPINFNSPLKAANIIDFWSRWHITLTRLLTDYVYTPLAIKASRVAAQRKFKHRRMRKTFEFVTILSIPTLFTMLLSGIWHGAGYQFIVFGLLHGSYLVINQTWRAMIPVFFSNREKYEKIFYPLGVLLTLFSVCFTMLFFRADNIDISYQMAASMLGMNGISLPEGIFVHLGSLQELLLTIGISADTTAGSAITYGASYCLVLLFIALVFPNSLDIMRNFKPALDYSPKVTDRFDWLFNNKITTLLIWKPNMIWGITMGIIIAIGILSLQGLSVFLYWQF
ncbi:MAG: MBOAT family protein, partial [Gammaproteobacteria bacterium]|nr:MBOAT family protein [Gammaproteobacteria bacterium]